MADIYVNHTGTSTPPYDSEARAAKSIQTALDAAVSGDTIWIKADAGYVMNGADQQAAQFDADVSDNITIRGYYNTTGDLDYGGTYYKDQSRGWAIMDANNGAFHVFSAGDKKRLRWQNMKIINVNASYFVYDLTPPAEQQGYLLQNCVITGGKCAVYGANLGNLIIRDCTFSGSYSPLPIFGVICLSNSCMRGSIIQQCNFSHGAAARSVYCQNIGMNVIEHNIFNIAGAVTSVIEIAQAGFLVNNVIHKASGGNIGTGVKILSGGHNTVICNNIIAGCTTGINDLAGINFGGWNCFHNNGSNWNLRFGDMAADPQFMNAANGDFRLKPASPCLNRGRPVWGGFTSIGAWQRKSLLR